MTHQTLRWKVLEKNLKPSEFTEKDMDAPSDESIDANPEVSQKSRPHSVEHCIDEKELRSNKSTQAKCGLGKPSDSSPKRTEARFFFESYL